MIRRYCSAAKLLPFEAIPGPKYFDLLGPTINNVITVKKAENLNLTIDEYHRKYGEIFRIKLSGYDSIFVSSAAMMSTIFGHEGKYPKHVVPEAWTYFNRKFGVKRGLVFMDDDEWLTYRQLLNKLMLKDFKWTEPLIEGACDNLINTLKNLVENSDGFVEVPNLEQKLSRWTVDVIMNVMLGHTHNPNENKQLSDMLDEFSAVSLEIFESSANLMNIAPHLADKFQLKIWTKFEKIAQKSIKMSQELVQIMDKDMTHGNGLFSKMKAENVPHEIIVRVFGDLMIAAADTTANTTIWILHQMASNELLQSALKDEVKFNSFDHPLVRGCLKESMRLYPVAPFLGRFLDSEAAIGGYNIPKMTLALMSVYTSSRNPKYFPQPDCFAPERWSRSEQGLKQVLNPRGTIPFALGARACVGKKMANYQMQYLLTKTLQSFHLKSLNTSKVNFTLRMIGVPDSKIRIAIKSAQI